MSKKTATTPKVDKKVYKKQLYDLQVQLVKLQNHIIRHDDKILVLLEGRDAAGKDGAIKRITQYLSPREVRTVALGKPSDREQGSWYFQRYVSQLPGPQEMVLFNRSWYNRAGVERVMGFCTDDEYERFMETVSSFETMLVKSGIRLLKYYLDISKDVQHKRLAARRTDPLKQWKISPIDAKAQKLWDKYSVARDAMLARTHHEYGPWTIVPANDKRTARLSIIRNILSRLDYDGKDKRLMKSEPNGAALYDGKLKKCDLVCP